MAVTYGTNNTALGYAADVTTDALTNATVIGNGAKVNDSDKVRIGNASVTVIEGQDYRESTALVQTGFLAQEVEKACQELNFTFSGLHVPASAVDNYGLAYGSFVPLLVKAVQEQQAEIGNLSAKVQQLQSQLAEMDDLKTRLARLEAALVLIRVRNPLRVRARIFHK